MRISDWSSDVCSSDLALDDLVDRAIRMAREAPEDKWAGLAPADRLLHGAPPHLDLADRAEPTPEALKALALEAEDAARARSEEHTSELQSLMRISYAVFCLKKKKQRSS